MKKISILLVATTVAATAPLAFAKHAASPHYGPVSLTLNAVYAYAPNGSRDPSKDAECHSLYEAFLGSNVKTVYSTAPTMSWAHSAWAAKGHPNVDFKLHPLGLAGVYAYGNWYRKEFNGKEVYGVTFTANREKSGDQPAPPYNSTISFIANPNLTCALTNAPTAETMLTQKPAKAAGGK